MTKDTLPAIKPQSPDNSGNVHGLGRASSAPMLGSKTSPLGATAKRKMELQEEKTQAFIDRQFKHSSLQPRRNMSLLQREVVKHGRAADDVEFYGSKGKEGFRQYLLSKFGTIVCGWRALDRDKSGRLSFQEFCNACRAMGYHGNLKRLWNDLDTNKSGMVSLMEIDADVGHYVGTFKLALLRKYGDMLTAWTKGVDINGNGHLQEFEIAEAVGTLGLDLNPKKLYKMLTKDGKVGLCLHEFDPDAWVKWVSGDHASLLLSDNQEFLEDLPELEGEARPASTDASNSGAMQEMRKRMVKDATDDRKQIHEKIEKMKAGLYTPDGIRQALVTRCGSLLGAWREALDLDGNGRLTFGEFCMALHRLGYIGEIRNLWHQLTGNKDDSGFLLFRDLDPRTDSMLAELTEKLTQEYENMLLAWIKGLDTRGSGLVAEKQFVDCCNHIGFSGDAKLLFKLMQPDKGRTLMTIRDFDRKAFLALSRGDYRMLSEPGQGYVGKSPLQMTFHERNEAGFFFQIRRAADASRRTEFAKACRTANTPDRLIDTVEEFEDLCIRKYGSLMGAWRQCLDDDVNGKLTFGEFCGALRRLGYAGDFKSLYQQYDQDKKGHIALRDLDPEADEIVNRFLKMLGERFGTLDVAWKDGFRQDPHGSISRENLIEACNVMGYPYDPNKLFKCLQPSPGKQLITIWDLDPECSRKRERGHQAVIISEPRDLGRSPLEKKHFSSGMDASMMASTRSNTTLPSKSFHSYNGPTPAQQLRSSLKVNYGSTVAAWRVAIDPHLQGGCGFGKFMVVLEDCAFAGKVKALWDELSAGRPAVTFEDIDPDSARLLNEFREHLVSSDGCILQAWHTHMDIDGTGRLDEVEFLKALERMGFVTKNPKKLFRMLLARHGQRSVVLEDFQALLIGVPAEKRAGIWAPSKGNQETGKKSALQEQVPGTPKTMSMLSYGGELSPKAHAEQVNQRHHEGDFIIRTLDDFKRMLVNKFGSLFASWRHGLDVDQNGVVTQADFATACRNLGVKAIQKLWTELDANQNGQISLYEIDSEVAEPFAQLEDLMIRQYGSTKKAWAETFNRDKSLRCDLEKFVAVLEELGFQGDAERFFKLLRPEPGRPYLAYEDLWLNLDMNDFRAPGEEPSGSPLGAASPLASQPSSPTGMTAADRRSSPQMD